MASSPAPKTVRDRLKPGDEVNPKNRALRPSQPQGPDARYRPSHSFPRSDTPASSSVVSLEESIFDDPEFTFARLLSASSASSLSSVSNPRQSSPRIVDNIAQVVQPTKKSHLSRSSSTDASDEGSKKERYDVRKPRGAPSGDNQQGEKHHDVERPDRVKGVNDPEKFPDTRVVTGSSVEVVSLKSDVRLQGTEDGIPELVNLPHDGSITDSLPSAETSFTDIEPAATPEVAAVVQEDGIAPATPETALGEAASPERDLILPAPLVPPSGGGSRPETDSGQTTTHEDEKASGSEQVAAEKGETAAAYPSDPEHGLLTRAYQKFRASYAPAHDPLLVLPSAPTDEEKLSYLHTNRIPLYAFGVFSFLSLSAGMWLFAVASVYFSWFGAFAGLLEIYLFISYMVGIVGKDWDHDAHKKIMEENPITKENAPTVDIFLPCCKEPLEILENTYKHIRALEYPAKDRLKVHVMDDGAIDAVKELSRSYGFNYLVRDDRPRLKKAGNLRWTFARTQGEFFTIFDADFCPRADFLLELLPEHMADDKTAIVQSPQFFRVKEEQTWVEQGAGAVQELFYRVVQVNRNRWGASICVGSNAIYRRAALEEVGGTAEIGYSEDVHTGFGAVHRGWKVKYLPLCLACGVCPDTPHAFFSQQMRWCMGSTTLLSNPAFWRSKLSFVQKVCYLCGMMYYSAVALSIFISPMPGVFLIWIRPEYFKYYNLAFALPSIIYGLVLFRVWAKAKYGIHVQYIMVIQSYAYLTAIKDRIFGTALQWAPTGDAKAHKNNKYRNMRILCFLWLGAINGGLISGVVYRVIQGLNWYHAIPVLVLDAFNLFIAHRFLLYQG